MIVLSKAILAVLPRRWLGLVINQQSQHCLKGESFLDFDMRMGNIGGEI